MATVPRVTLTRREAAASLGVGITFFEERVQPELRVIRLGARVLVPVAKLNAGQPTTPASSSRVLTEAQRTPGVGDDPKRIRIRGP